MNEELYNLYTELKESGRLEELFPLNDIRKAIESNIDKIADKTTETCKVEVEYDLDPTPNVWITKPLNTAVR